MTLAASTTMIGSRISEMVSVSCWMRPTSSVCSFWKHSSSGRTSEWLISSLTSSSCNNSSSLRLESYKNMSSEIQLSVVRRINKKHLFPCQGSEIHEATLSEIQQVLVRRMKEIHPSAYQGLEIPASRTLATNVLIIWVNRSAHTRVNPSNC